MDIAKLTSTYRSTLIKTVYAKWLKKGDKVFDLGCGNGLAALYLKKNLSINVVGGDIKNYLSADIPFVQIPNDYKLPFKKNQFDACMLNDVLHHIKKIEQVKLIYEALKISPKVLIFEAKDTVFAKFFDVILNKLHYGDLEVPLSFRSSQEWARICQELPVKFQIIELDKPLWYPFFHIAISLTRI